MLGAMQETFEKIKYKTKLNISTTRFPRLTNHKLQTWFLKSIWSSFKLQAEMFGHV